MSDLVLVLAVARRDARQELRSRAVTVATVFFSGITVVILSFALGPDPDDLRRAAPGILWVALAFAGVISAAQSYQNELAEGAFEQLLISPIPRAAIYVGKLLANWLTMFLLGLLMLAVIAVLFDLPLGRGGPLLVATLASGTLGFSLIATFYAALTANLRARESLLPVLMFPVVVPVLLAAVRATETLLGPGQAAGAPALAGSWLQLLVGFDLAYFVVCTAIFHFVVEE